MSVVSLDFFLVVVNIMGLDVVGDGAVLDSLIVLPIPEFLNAFIYPPLELLVFIQKVTAFWLENSVYRLDLGNAFLNINSSIIIGKT